VLAIDQGTTSTRAILFDAGANVVAIAQHELTQHYPQRGWVEHDPEEIWDDTLAAVREALDKSRVEIGRVAAIGITNQRETIVVWDRATGEPIHRAIVWQDRRTADDCARLKSEGAEALVRSATGLLLDPYFSATKIAWVLDHVAGEYGRAHPMAAEAANQATPHRGRDSNLQASPNGASSEATAIPQQPQADQSNDRSSVAGDA